MRKVFIILLGSMTTLLQAQSAEDLFARANTQYNLGQYQEALVLYDSIVALGQHSADLYFNKGNAHYKLNQIAPSILNYEKALLLDSGHKGVLTNLPFAQNMTLDAIESLPETGFSVFSYEWMAAIVLIIFAIFFLPFYLRSKIYTLPEFLEKRFAAKT